MGPGRLHALIDGIFAIAITLLVLDLPKPAASAHITTDLLHQWPSYAAYLVSFVTLGIVWIEHHGMMSAVRHINRRFLERNLAFLLVVSVMPWPTSLAATYARRGAQATPTAVLYGATMLCMGLAFAWSWRYLRDHPELVVAAAPASAFEAGFRRALLGSVAYLVAIGVAFGSAMGSYAIDAAVAIYFAASSSAVPGLVAASSSDAE